jgi:hypothetical protein
VPDPEAAPRRVQRVWLLLGDRNIAIPLQWEEDVCGRPEEGQNGIRPSHSFPRRESSLGGFDGECLKCQRRDLGNAEDRWYEQCQRAYSNIRIRFDDDRYQRAKGTILEFYPLRRR